MEEITRSEHRAIVFKMNRKEAAAVARYIKDHSGSPETIFAVDVDTLEMIIQAKNAHEDDVLVLDRTVDVNITRLRKKIGEYGKRIITRQGYGYCFNP